MFIHTRLTKGYSTHRIEVCIGESRFSLIVAMQLLVN